MFIYHKMDNKLRFCKVVCGKINIESLWEDRIFLEKKEAVLYIESMMLAPRTITASKLSTMIEETSLIAMASAVISPAYSEIKPGADWEKAKNLWKDNKKIPGGIFLTPSGFLIWISEIDQLHFEKF